MSERRWTPVVDGVTSARPLEPTATDRMKEWQLEAKQRDREERQRHDPSGLGVWGVEELSTT
jgi:hypothetical protein